MKKLAKKDLHLMGSAGSLEALKKLMLEKLYWSKVELSESTHFQSRLGKCYDIENGGGFCETMVVIEGKRCSLYTIIEA